MGICTVKDMERTRRRLVLLSSTMVSAVALAMKSLATVILNGVFPEKSSSPPLISVHQTLLCPTTMAAGATLLFNTSIWLSLPFSKSLSTVPESFPFLSKGQIKNQFLRFITDKTIHFSFLFFFSCLISDFDELQSTLYEEGRNKIHH